MERKREILYLSNTRARCERKLGSQERRAERLGRRRQLSPGRAAAIALGVRGGAAAGLGVELKVVAVREGREQGRGELMVQVGVQAVLR